MMVLIGLLGLTLLTAAARVLISRWRIREVARIAAHRGTAGRGTLSIRTREPESSLVNDLDNLLDDIAEERRRKNDLP